MTKFVNIAQQFCDDESGAAMVEYSIVVGLIAAAAILTMIAIGLWVNGRFTGLCNNMQGSGVGTCNAAAGTGT